MEIWRDIEDYQDIYQVSNYGRVRSLARIDSRGWKRQGRLLKQHTTKGYSVVGLCNKGSQKMVKVHRLVASSFCLNYFDGAVVNHIDGNKQNNQAPNLEWCNQSHNMLEFFKYKRSTPLDKHLYL